jgi:hypothetical protein
LLIQRGEVSSPATRSAGIKLRSLPSPIDRNIELFLYGFDCQQKKGFNGQIFNIREIETIYSEAITVKYAETAFFRAILDLFEIRLIGHA